MFSGIIAAVGLITHLTAREAAETAFNVLDTLVSAAVKQLAQDVLQDIFSEITAAHYGAPVIPALAADPFSRASALLQFLPPSTVATCTSLLQNRPTSATPCARRPRSI